MIQDNLVLEPIRRISPSRYTAMRSCLLREAWTAAGNEPPLPPSPLAELGTIIHELLGAAGRGEFENGSGDKIQRMWLDLISQAEKRMELSAQRRHQVPLVRSIPDYEVRRLRACNRALEISGVAVRGHVGRPRQGPIHSGFEMWVESHDGRIGGYIDRATKTPEGIVLSDYKSGSVMLPGKCAGPGTVRRAYKEQLILYAALYQLKFGLWPVRLELVPLQGVPVAVSYDICEAQRLLTEADELLRNANHRIAEVESRRRGIVVLASPCVENCRLCLFRPACQAYWHARTQGAQAKWPADVKGMVEEKTRLSNGKVCMRIRQSDLPTPSHITVRNLTDGFVRHSLLAKAQPGAKVALYGLNHDYHSGDYKETQNTVVFVAD